MAKQSEQLKITKDEIDARGFRVLWLHTASRTPITRESRQAWRAHPRVSRVARRKNAHKAIVELFPCADATTKERDEVLADLISEL